MSAPATAPAVHYGYRTLRLPEFDLEGHLSYDLRQSQLILTELNGDAEVLSVDLRAEGFIAFPGEVIVKDWSEHAGLAEALIDADVAIRIETLCVGPFASRAYRLQLLDPEVTGR